MLLSYSVGILNTYTFTLSFSTFLAHGFDFALLGAGGEVTRVVGEEDAITCRTLPLWSWAAAMAADVA